MNDASAAHVAPFTLHVGDWRSLRTTLDYARGYLCRGHAVAGWNFEPSLYRNHNLRDAAERSSAERALLTEFRRQAHHYVQNPPNQRRDIEWMALLRHYGGPSRLIDVTRSPYVAAFFALANADVDGGEACIWIVHEGHIRVNAPLHLESLGRVVDKSALLHDVEQAEFEVENHLGEGAAAVVPIEPFRLNDRIAVQQGLFLGPLSLEGDFYSLLRASVGIKDLERHEAKYNGTNADLLRRQSIAKISFPTSIKNEALEDLRLMNVSAATLYPGLEGFVASLTSRFSSGIGF